MLEFVYAVNFYISVMAINVYSGKFDEIDKNEQRIIKVECLANDTIFKVCCGFIRFSTFLFHFSSF